MVPNNLDDLVDLDGTEQPVEEIWDENVDLNEANVPIQEEIHHDDCNDRKNFLSLKF